MNIIKPIKNISGIACYPIKKGERALIEGKDSRITSVVVNVISQTDKRIVFETKNTVYDLKCAA